MKKIMACLVIMAALTGCSKSDDQGGGLSTPENTLPKKNDDHGGKERLSLKESFLRKLSTKQKTATLAMK